MSIPAPKTAMVLAAGQGTRLRPITDTLPKPLVKIEGRTLLDRGLDTLVAAGVTRAIVNVHHLGAQVIDHLKTRHDVEIIISDERNLLLNSGGAIIKALPHLGDAPFYVLNADTFWLDESGRELKKLAYHFDSKSMDVFLMLADQAKAIGHSESGDFSVAENGQLSFAVPPQKASAPIYAGACIMKPEIFANGTEVPHSLIIYLKAALAGNRLYGAVMDTTWITVGTPDALEPAALAVRQYHANSH